ncbi:response regulator [Algirhabdus cladophorae]|uniref:response regulator n=1 Tax=Algirhabdus cladophorae TaxID=3377108 RepID=UPI003B84A6E5
MPTVIIADDHAFTVQGMVQAIKDLEQFDVVATCANGMEAIVAAKTHRPDLALLDLSMPDLTGLEAFLEIQRWSPDTRVVVITGNPVSGLITQLIEAGIHGLFVKSAPPQEIFDGIQRVADGENVYAQDFDTLVTDTSEEALSAREIEVLGAIAKGLSNPKIADRLGISPKTVESHRGSLMRKLGVHSTASLLIQAVKKGLIDV